MGVHVVLCLLFGPILAGSGLTVTMDWRLFLVWMALDQLQCFLVYWQTSVPFGVQRLMKHIVCGTASQKVYYVVVFGCLQGLQIDLLLCAVVSVLTWQIDFHVMHHIYGALGIPAHQVRYYVDHRICHLPGVYAHAHKFHHHLHDTTPWDAFLFGSGMNETYFWWFLEILPCLIWSGQPYWMFPLHECIHD